MSKYVFDESIKLAENAMLKARPELFDEWDFEKNDELGLDIYKVTKGSNKKANWKCKDCNSYWNAVINNRTNNSGCPYCKGAKVNHTNSLQSLNPELAKEWHPTKNRGLIPEDVTTGANRKAWWLGECGHEWQSIINSRNNGAGCPYCTNQKILKGYNDMWTTNPELAKLLANPEDGYKYSEFSQKILDWNCLDCNSTIKNKRVAHVNNRGISCVKCSDGFSFPEKVLYCVLTMLEVEFEMQVVFEWSENKRYDFYIPIHNLVIEVHGLQHYETNTFEVMSGTTLNEVRQNDLYKEILAKSNNISSYITIDARISEIEWIKENILKSELSNLYNLKKIDWDKVYINSRKSIMKKVCELFNLNKLTISEISSELNISKTTTYKYIRHGVQSGICHKNNKKIMSSDFNSDKKKSVVQLDKNGNVINIFNSMKEASLKLRVDYRGISSCVNGRTKSSYGYVWKLNNTKEESLL